MVTAATHEAAWALLVQDATAAIEHLRAAAATKLGRPVLFSDQYQNGNFAAGTVWLDPSTGLSRTWTGTAWRVEQLPWLTTLSGRYRPLIAAWDARAIITGRGIRAAHARPVTTTVQGTSIPLPPWTVVQITAPITARIDTNAGDEVIMTQSPPASGKYTTTLLATQAGFIAAAAPGSTPVEVAVWTPWKPAAPLASLAVIVAGVDRTRAAISVAARRGTIDPAPLAPPEAGSATIALDGWVYAVTGSRIRLMETLTGRTIWAGRAIDVDRERRTDRNGRTLGVTTTVTAGDAVSAAARTQKRGRSGTDLTVSGHISEAMPPWPPGGGGSYRDVPDLRTVRTCDTVFESSLARHMTLALATVPATWAMSADGHDLIVQGLSATPTTAPVAALHDTTVTAGDKTLSPAQFVVRESTRDLVNSASVLNHQRNPDGSAHDVEAGGMVSSTIDQAGKRHARVDTVIATDQLAARANTIASAALTPGMWARIVAATLRGTDRIGGTPTGRPAAALELLDPITTQSADVPRRTQLVVGIDHQITPAAWKTHVFLDSR